jgi:hypothetical protein
VYLFSFFFPDARPVNVYSDSEQGDEILPFIPSLGVREGESIHDFSWFPLMNAQGKMGVCITRKIHGQTVYQSRSNHLLLCYFCARPSCPTMGHGIRHCKMTVIIIIIICLSLYQVQASYCAIDHTERFIGPNVLAFNLDGSK